MRLKISLVLLKPGFKVVFARVEEDAHKNVKGDSHEHGDNPSSSAWQPKIR